MCAVLRSLIFLLMLMAAPAVAAPLEAYARLPAIEVSTVSPSGARVAVGVSDGEQRSVLVHDIKAGRPVARANFGDVPVEALRWAGEDHVLVTTHVQYDAPRLSGGLREWRRVHVFNLADQSIKPLLDDAPAGLSHVLRAPTVRTVAGQPMVFLEGLQFVDGVAYAAIYRADLATGRSTVVQRAVAGVNRWVLDGEGRVVGRQIAQPKLRRTSVEVRVGDDWREVASAEGDRRVRLVALGRDGRSLLIAAGSADEDETWSEQPFDGGPARPVTVPANHTVLTDPQTGRLIGHAGWDGDRYEIVYLDPAGDAVAKAMREAYPAAYASIASWSKDLQIVTGLVDSPGQLPGYALYDHRTRNAGWLGPEYPDLTAADVGPQTRIRFKASDGLELTGYLTRPPGRAQAKGLPLVVFPQMAPSDRATPGFDWRVQAIASRGYAVLQLNGRGATGLSDALWRAGEGEIGRKMQTDLSDAVKLLADAGAVDASRVCILGFRYGGYAALMGLVGQPGVYRCAVAHSGYFELRWPLGPDAPAAAVAAAQRRLGIDGPSDPRLATYSPVKQAAKVQAPVMLIYGRNDTANTKDGAEAMAAALRKAGKPVEVVVLPDGDLQLRRADARVRILNAIVGFLEAHNPPN